MPITTIEPQARRPDWWNVSLDGRFAFSLPGSVVVSEGLAVGGELSPEDIERLRAASEEGRVLDAALRFLAPRPRSRAEVRRRLLQPRPNRPSPAPELVEHVLERLEDRGLLDDAEFAGFWVDQRERFSPRSAYAITRELRQRGVDAQTAATAADPALDLERALAAGRARLRSLRTTDYEVFRAKLGAFLQRRGFGFSVAREAVRALWEETSGARPDDDDGADS